MNRAQETDELLEMRRCLLAQLEEVSDAEDSLMDDETEDAGSNEPAVYYNSNDECSMAEETFDDSTNLQCPYTKMSPQKVVDEPEASSSRLDDSDLNVAEEHAGNSVNRRRKDGVVLKTVLAEELDSCFATLPEGWKQITHDSGLPVYLHTKSRVVSLTRPYFLGPGSIRRHMIPLDSIPCLFKRRKLDKMKTVSPIDIKTGDISEEIKPGEAVKSSTLQKQEDYQLSQEEVTEYARRLFDFKEIEVLTSEASQSRKIELDEHKQAETLREYDLTVEELENAESVVKTNKGISLINIPTLSSTYDKRRYVINPTNIRSVALLHKYGERVLRGTVLWLVNENPTPGLQSFTAVAVVVVRKAALAAASDSIGEKLALLKEKNAGTAHVLDLADELEGIFVGRGTGPSRKLAQRLAAKLALSVFMPEITFNSDYIASIVTDAPAGKSYDMKAYEILENLEIEDVRVHDTCLKTSQMKPYRLLQELSKNSLRFQGMSVTPVVKMTGSQQPEVTVKCVRQDELFEATVTAKSTASGREKAAQVILKKMHPNIISYGSLLRLYSNIDEKEDRRLAADNHNEVVRMPLGGPINEPNKTVQTKLREEMMRIPPPICTRPAINAHFERVQ